MSREEWHTIAALALLAWLVLAAALATIERNRRD